MNAGINKNLLFLRVLRVDRPLPTAHNSGGESWYSSFHYILQQSVDTNGCYTKLSNSDVSKAQEEEDQLSDVVGLNLGVLAS